MVVKNPTYIQDLCYTPQDDRLNLSGLLCGEGVSVFDGLRVTQSSPPAKSVTVSAGHAYIRSDNQSSNGEDGYYHFFNDADVVIPVDDNPGPGSVTYVVWARVCDSAEAAVASGGALILGAPDDTDPPSDGCTYYKLATVVATAGFITINGEPTEFGDTDNNITDDRNLIDVCGSGGALREQLVLTSTAGGSLDLKTAYPWMKSVKVRAQGGGGGGAGAGSAGATNAPGVGSGGGAGAYLEKVYRRDEIPDGSSAWDVGTGGAGATAGNGAAGGATTFLGLSAGGGSGGTAVAGATNTDQGLGGGAGGVATGGDLNLNGGNGGDVWAITKTNTPAGTTAIRGGGAEGAPSFFGGGTGTLREVAANFIDGEDGRAYGAGGQGSISANGGDNATGGDGAAGVLIIELFG